MACEEYFSEAGIKPYFDHIDVVAKYFVKH
jgi:hypothetical protein